MIQSCRERKGLQDIRFILWKVKSKGLSGRALGGSRTLFMDGGDFSSFIQDYICEVLCFMICCIPDICVDHQVRGKVIDLT